MSAYTSPTDEWFTLDRREARASLDDDSVAEFRRNVVSKPSKKWLIGAASVGFGLALLSLLFGGSSPEPTATVAAAAAVEPARAENEADWEAQVEQRDPGFVVKKRELPLDR